MADPAAQGTEAGSPDRSGVPRVEDRTLRVADLGPPNPLPMVGDPLESPYAIDADVPEEILEGARYGHPANLHPYRLQDGYDRARPERTVRTVVLENERLRAVFLPELGGRLWELTDRVTGKQLLHSPPSIQFANLALRNAWFAGGIEWNIGTRGHSPTTCEPLHTGVVRTPDRRDVLRMWEYERLRGVVFSVDAWLPPGSPALFVAVRIRNPQSREVPMYWWSNAAVPEDDDSRVLAPADTAFASDYATGIARTNPTSDGGIDATRPARNPRARDFFFDLAPGRRPWILNADREGDGLVMLSTARLRGRKLFVWGRGEGGRRWQEWLSPDGGRYAEIQAGLAQTQFQHLRMPAGVVWTWVEAYGNAAVDPALAHGEDWAEAVRHAESRVAVLLPSEALEAALRVAEATADVPPARILQHGSGWGAVEAALRRRVGAEWIDEAGTPFSTDAIGPDERPWYDLATGDAFAGSGSSVRGPEWDALLAAQQPASKTLLHRATLAHAEGELDRARALYEESLRPAASAGAPPARADRGLANRAHADRGLAHRGLALVALAAGNVAGGCAAYRAACAADPSSRPLRIEAVTALLAAGDATGALELLSLADPAERERGAEPGRLRFLRALALARTGRSEESAALLREGIEVPDLREGENSLSALWREVCADEPVPARYQFGMG